MLAVSHNHADHDVGASDVLTHYPNRIGCVFILQDKPAKDMRFARTLLVEVEKGALKREQIRNLQLDRPGQPKPLWRSKDGSLCLVLLYPDFVGNLGAQQRNDQNATSAVLTLKGPGARILFSGNCTLDGWRALHEWQQSVPLNCSIVLAPHHGGCLAGEQDIDGMPSYQWLYERCIHAEVGVISVGTSNQHGHPLKEVVEAMRRSGTYVMCTQITSQCCDNLDALRPGAIRPSRVCLSSFGRQQTGGGSPKNVACAGSVVAEITDSGCTIARLDEHRVALNSNTLLQDRLCR